MVKDRYLTRVIRAYPDQSRTQLHEGPGIGDDSNADEVLARFLDATAAPIGKAIALAVMLDQDERGEIQMNESGRERALVLFEEIFKSLA